MRIWSVLLVLTALLPTRSYGIIGGTEVNPTDPIAQTVVQVWRIHPKNREQVASCSGILVDRDVVFTAAHCTFLDMEKKDSPLGTNNLFVYVGKFDSERGFQKEDIYRIDSYRVHPQYIPTQDKDIAVLKLERPISNNWRPLPVLSGKKPIKKSEQIVVAGFGNRRYGQSELGSPLQKYDKYRVWSYRGKSSQLKLQTRWGKGSYLGDSGGPAFVIRNGNLFVWGVFSVFIYIENENVTGEVYYEDFRQSMNWINKTLLDLGSSFRLN